MKQALVAVAILAVMTSILVMFKKRVDAEADGTAYELRERTLGDKLFGRGKYAGGRALGTGASDGEEATSPLATALAGITASPADAEADAETDAAADAAADAETDAAADADAETGAAAPAFGLARALGAEAPIDDGEPEGRGEKIRTVDESVEIDAPVEQVWAYVGKNANARQWSVYFHHISSLPGIAEGQVGALRRCFRNEDESGRRWDERLVEVVPNRLRKIHVFNLSGFWPESSNAVEHEVWQVYEPLGPDRTRLTFRTRPVEGGAKATLVALTSKRRSTTTFRENLENIKAAVEQGASYVRPHPYWD